MRITNEDKVEALAAARREATIQQMFLDFHEAHPEVYAELVKLCRQARAAGYRQGGIAMVWEVLRWHRLFSPKHDVEDFKLNNNHKSRYARLIMEKEKDLADFFETRTLKVE